MSMPAAPSKSLHIATLRIFLYTDSEVEAVVVADEIAEEIVKEYLDEEDGDRAEVTQVTPFRTDVEPVEVLTILARARNALIRTRIKQCYEEASALDQLIHALRHRETSSMLPPYDYGAFLEVAQSILQENKDPL